MAMQEEQLPQDVVRFHAAITQMIGNTFSYEQLVEAISICHCNKAIVVEYGTLDEATHGYSVELRDCILIVIRKRLGYTLDWFTRLHELGHAGLGHLRYVNLTRAQWHKEWKQNPKM